MPSPSSRIGLGNDVHRLVPGRKLILGGIHIPFEQGPLGHSDGDALAHAICDALLGAAALGDIGRHFPDSSAKWKNASSLDFLRHVAGLLEARDFAIVNIDSTIELEKPRLAPFIESMRERIAAALGLAVEQVNVKAKSGEAIGEIGRGEAIRAEAVALIRRSSHKVERLIEFNNRAGRRLRGMLHRPDTSGEHRPPGVVLLHGFTGDRMESHWLFVKASRALAGAGIASLRFDFFGSGESDGEFREASLDTEVADAQDAADFLRREGGIDPERLGIIGLSLGGAIAAVVAEPIRARALVLWSAIAHLPLMHRFADSFARPLNDGSEDAEYGGHRVSHRFLDAVDRLDPLAGVAAFTGPTLIVHPERDEHLPLTHPEDYLRASGAEVKEKVIVSNADHTFTSVAGEAEAIGRTVEWFRQNL